MKRYKQSILSDYFVTRPEHGVRHIVGANYDIEDQGNRALCSIVVVTEAGFEVLSNRYLAGKPGSGNETCHICKALLDQRISNMPGQVKLRAFDSEPRQFELPVHQLGLDL
ncbi:hypothetical protein [Parendozoicomonas haliclonae]|uniref:Uncharacterized protein n=1 Tax=Parendozoicomonas haliclonae TaxID=1960125 RepID=A0A1X7AQU8_9GAMM|nr:hypothetical protein [Parendozoicomonas haliclonae]SMA50676.1 hypothetical protein EHSB41UT_04493 [Parendozoicomonas haliclonae]